MKRSLVASLAGLIVGTGVWAAVNSVPWWDPWGFWGFFFGVPAAVTTFGLSLMLLARGRRVLEAAGRWTAVVVLVLFGLVVLLGPYGAIYQSPFSLEGMWIWPLALAPLILASWLIWLPRRKRRPGPWGAPPAAKSLLP